MERRGVLIEAGVVRNVIVWGDNSKAQYEADGWDQAIETTGLERQPGIDWTWDKTNGFREPQPYPSWSWSKAQASWIPPTARPDDGQNYQWDETTTSWVVVSAE